MGARASRRRHEGRVIRRRRRQMRQVGQGFRDLGRAAERAAKPMARLGAAFGGFSERIATGGPRAGGVLTLSQVGVPYPTQSGVEAVRSPQSAADRVDAAAARMGIELDPWQRELAIATIAGIPMAVQWPQGRGKVAVTEVVEQARGVDASLGWIDEAVDL